MSKNRSQYGKEIDENTVLESVYTNGVFEVRLAYFFDASIDSGILGYGVFNLTTGVREAECRRISIARELADMFSRSDGTDKTSALSQAAVLGSAVNKTPAGYTVQ